MTLNRFWILFFSTLAIGVATGFLNALFGWFRQYDLFYGVQVGGFVSATALMGFWGYLMLNFTMHSFLHPRLWTWIQLLIIAFTAYDMVYFRHLQFGGASVSWLPFIAYGLYPLLWAALVAAIKVQITNRRAYIPTLFFMYVFTLLEWYVALKANQAGITETIGIILMVCNAWLVLILSKILVKPKSQAAHEQKASNLGEVISP
ncbi:MAG: hypothetical protein JWN30_1967 [Bacilli bacterium]|nr:hypothetical protein [Bacilli bacterium]